MSFFNRVNIAQEELDEAPILEGGENVEMPEEEFIGGEEDEVEVAEISDEINNDNEAISEAETAASDLAEVAETNEQALENPEEVTEEQVEAAQESLKICLAKLGMVDMYKEANSQFKLAHESYSSPAERLQVAQEGIKETIGKIIEWIRNLFRKILLWFKKMYAKLTVLFNRSQAKAKKLKAVLAQRKGNIDIPVGEYRSLCAGYPGIGMMVANGKTLMIDKDATIVDKMSAVVKDLANDIKTAANQTNVSREANDKGQENKAQAAASTAGEKLAKVGNVSLVDGINLQDIIEDDIGNNHIFLRIDGTKAKVITFEKDENGVTFEIKNVNYDIEAFNSKLNNAPTKDNLNTIINAAVKQNISKMANSAFKAIKEGDGLVKSFEIVKKAADANDNGGTMSINGYQRAANVGRKIGTEAVIDVVIGTVRAQSQLLSLVGKCLTYVNKKADTAKK